MSSVELLSSPIPLPSSLSFLQFPRCFVNAGDGLVFWGRGGGGVNFPHPVQFSVFLAASTILLRICDSGIGVCVPHPAQKQSQGGLELDDP